MRRYLKARYLIPALLALVMVVYGAIISISSTRTNLEDFAEVAHSHTVLALLEDTLSAMQDMETGQRGFVITGNPSFLEPYNAARGLVEGRMNELADQVHKDPEELERVGAAREAAGQKIEELEKVIEVRRTQGAEPAMALIVEGRGKRLMDRFRTDIAEMRIEEENRLIRRQDKLVESFKSTNNTVVISAAVAIGAAMTGLVLLALFLISRDQEARMRFEKEKAEQADKAKTDFLAMMSHEIRTPMNAILGFGELLHDAVEKPQEKHFAKAILSSGNSLLSLINDILDLSKIEAAKLEMRPETVEMRRFIENLETLFSFRAQEKGLDYSIHAHVTLPRYLSFDALRLRQVLVNLIGNAIKFTRTGQVSVGVSAKPQAEIMLLEFEVSDTGIGIPAEKLEEIFKPFYQVESEHGRHFQGTGLGLSISERLVNLMGGKIEVESEAGKGSTFRLSIPVEMREELSLATDFSDLGKAADFNRLKPSKILVVDDVALNRELIRGYLSGSHHQVLEAENGEQAVILGRKHLPEIVLMDIRMPVLDGRAAHALLKGQEETKHIPLIAVTASSLLDSQSELKRIFDGFASKPLSRERLYMELSKFLPVNSTAVSPRPEPQVSRLPEMSFDRAWPELVKVLVPLRDSVWPGLVELVPAQATLQFGEHLTALARKHQCPPLEEYSQQLVDAAATMSFAEAGQLLAAFPDLIERLSHADL
jgi:signal transduction histidine kinase/ActR/RegA family two-component response regulator